MGVHLMGRHLIGMHLVGRHLMGMKLMSMHLMGKHLMGMHLIGMHLIGKHLIVPKVESGFHEYIYVLSFHRQSLQNKQCFHNIYTLMGIHLKDRHIMNRHLVGRHLMGILRAADRYTYTGVPVSCE
jgi:hypothetical protein